MYKLMDIMAPFLEDPQKGFYIREISRILNISPMTARKKLNILAKKGLLVKKKMKLHEEFKVNLDSTDFRILSKFYIMKKLYDSGLIKYLLEELLYPEAVFLFGSHARGDYTKDSDIDLFVLSNEKKEINFSKYEKKLKKKIQLHLMTSKEFLITKKKNPDLINNIINGLRISGYLEVV